jgi:DNA-binding transcriptional MerR regulator
MMRRVDGEQVKLRPRGLTIGQLAKYAHVTIKAVRHYHQRGLLGEPPRDTSGYRRYTAEHAIQLIKIRTLADAGVPLARIKPLLAGDSDQFAAAIAEIERNLEARINQLRQLRERMVQLNAGERLFVWRRSLIFSSNCRSSASANARCRASATCGSSCRPSHLNRWRRG